MIKTLDKRFINMMTECLFHQSRDNMYPTKQIKEVALQAMMNLWQTESLSFAGIMFSNQAIRDIILNEMMPEHLDFAIDEFMSYNRLDSVEILSYLIFIRCLSNNYLMNLFAEYDISHEKFNTKGGAA